MGIDDLRRTLDESLRTLGRDHPSTLVARRRLATAYFQAGDHLPAFTHQEEVVAGVTRLAGPDDRLTVATLTDLASTWFAGWLADSRPDLAIPLYELAVAERVRVTGANDPDTLSARNDLAAVYLATGQIGRASAALARTLADCADVLGEDHFLTRTVRANLESAATARAAMEVAPDRPRDDATTAGDIVQALADVLGVESTVTGGWLSVALPAVGETLHLPVHDIKRVTRSFTPMGDPALEFVLAEENDVRPLIVCADNVIFAPEDPVVVLRAPVPVVISNAPPLTSYAEMVAEAEGFAAAGRHGLTGEVAGSGLLLRCVIAGAVRCGMRPLRAVAWWQRGWEAGGAEWELPPFPKDPVWDHLLRSAAGVTLTPSPVAQPADVMAAISALTSADFAALEPRLRVVSLDDEFVANWKRLIPLTPAGFANILLARLDGARADLTLYPEGTGGIDMVVRDRGEAQALLQLRFDLPAGEIYIDEVRIAENARGGGLFQRMQYNTEQLGRALGVERLHVLATGIGAYAFARTGFPRDRELFAKVHGSGRG